MASFLRTMWHPLVDAVFGGLPFQLRWRLLLFQLPTAILYTWKCIPYLLSRPFVLVHIPTRRPGESLRALVYNHPSRCERLGRNKKRPLHIDIHGGGFIGGVPEDDTPFCVQVAQTTGAVVVSLTYRFAPRYPFPAAHDDVADAFDWLSKNAEREFGADTEIITMSGISAGGTLALGATLGAKDSRGDNIVKGAVTFYSPVDLRLRPQDKRKPPGFPPFDPATVFLPLADAYAGTDRMRNMNNPGAHPTLAPLENLPRNLLFVVPTIDILLDEQVEMVERLQIEAAEEKKRQLPTQQTRRIEMLTFEGQWHGWLERE